MELDYADISERTDQVLAFTEEAAEFITSSSSNTNMRELYHTTQEWVTYTYDTLEGLEKLRAAGLTGSAIETHRMRLCGILQSLILAMDALASSFDMTRPPRGDEDLM